MYLRNSLVFLACILPWSHAYIDFDLAPRSSYLLSLYSSSGQLLVKPLTNPSFVTFATDDSTKSVTPVEKNQESATEKSEDANIRTQDTTPCPEQENLECEDCGGQRYDREEGLYRCLGIKEDLFKWKDCFCLGNSPNRDLPYEPQGATLEEIREAFDNLPEWEHSSFAKSPTG